MEQLEFRCDSHGIVYFDDGTGESKRLTKFHKKIVSLMIERIKALYPPCYARLATLYSKVEKSEREFTMVERFIRCNMGNDDSQSVDLEYGDFNLEEVKCPLRGKFCKDEGVICKPQGLFKLSDTEKKVAKLYVRGMTFDKIANQLDLNTSTIKTILSRIKNKLGVVNCREIITVLRLGRYSL